MRLPCRRPCMSVSASRTVSTRSLAISVLSWSSVSAMAAGTLHAPPGLHTAHDAGEADHRTPVADGALGRAHSYLVREDDGVTLVDTMFQGSGAANLAAGARGRPDAPGVVHPPPR